MLLGGDWHYVCAIGVTDAGGLQRVHLHGTTPSTKHVLNAPGPCGWPQSMKSAPDRLIPFWSATLNASTPSSRAAESRRGCKTGSGTKFCRSRSERPSLSVFLGSCTKRTADASALYWNDMPCTRSPILPNVAQTGLGRLYGRVRGTLKILELCIKCSFMSAQLSCIALCVVHSFSLSIPYVSPMSTCNCIPRTLARH